MYNYILFDLDGTLTDPFEGISKSVIHALDSFGITVQDPKELEAFIGPPLFDQFKAQFHFDDGQAQKAVNIYRERYSEIGWKECTLIPNVKKLLKRLNENGIKSALATSKPEPFAKKILEYFDIDKYFAFIGGAELAHSGRNRKEDVIGYVLESLDVTDKSAVLMVGDRFYDIEGARLNGIKTIAFLGGYGSLEEFKLHKADFIASDMNEVGRLIFGA